MPNVQEPDIEGLREFQITDDRELTPFFVGRTDVIADIENNCLRRFKNWQLSKPAAMAGATRLIQGAPGAGKTAILDFLTERWRENPKAPFTVRANAKVLADESLLAAKIAGAMASGAGRKPPLTYGTHTGSTVGLPLTQFTREKSAATEARLDSWDALCVAVEAESWARPVCLLVDEVQNVDGRAAALQTLHEGDRRLPVMAVVAGLANSREKLRQAGISRFAEGGVHILWPLSPSEAARSAGMFLEHFRVQGQDGVTSAYARLIAEDSRGWPQHLHNGLRALARALVAAKGDLLSVKKEDVLDRSAEYRRKYYEARLTPKLKASALLLANVMRRTGEHGAPRDEFCNLVESCSREGRKIMERLPGGMAATDFVDHLIEVGVLHEDSGNVRCPVPSFRQYIIDRDRLARLRLRELPESDPYPLPSPFD